MKFFLLVLFILIILGASSLSKNLDSVQASEQNQISVKRGEVMFSETIRGYNVQIQNSSESTLLTSDNNVSNNKPTDQSRQILLVDGKNIPFLKTNDGYLIYYQEPQSDLISAVRCYLETQPIKPE